MHMNRKNSGMGLLVDEYNPTVLRILETSLNAIISNFLRISSNTVLFIYVRFIAWSNSNCNEQILINTYLIMLNVALLLDSYIGK